MKKITEIVLASRNKKKLGELAEILAPLGIRVRSVLEFPQVAEVEETGSTFFENAALKAESVSKELGCAVLADDSGLMVDYLDGAPGVYSARFSGENASDESNNRLLLEKLRDVPMAARGASFACVLAFSIPENESVFFEGRATGKIVDKESGDKGFGYDPLFLSDDLGVTFAQAGSAEKNKISHRARAVAKFVEWLKQR